MGNEYLDVLRADAGVATSSAPKTDNPYLTLLQEGDAFQKQAVSRSVSDALNTNPDQFAAQRRAAQYLGYTPTAAEGPVDIEQQAQLKRVRDDAASAPVLQKRYVDADFAKLARDDSTVLSSIESAVGKTVRYVMGADGRGGLPGDIKAGYHASSVAAAGAFRAVSETAALPFDFLERTDVVGGNPLRRLAEGFKMIAEDQKALQQASQSEVFGVSAGVQSTVQNAKYLPLAALGPAGAAAALYGMVAESFGTAYDKGRDAGLNQFQGLMYAGGDAAVEYWTEKLPLDHLVGALRAGAPFLQTLSRQLILEVPGEQVATILQDMNEWAVLDRNKGKTFNDYIAERPSRAAETLIATVVGTGGNVVLTTAADYALNGMAQRQMQQAYSEQDVAALQHLVGRAGESKLRQRSPDEFRTLVNEMGNNASIYVDGAVLAQMPTELQAKLPEQVRKEIPDAVAAGSAVAIPIGDALALAPGTEFEQVLLQHGRLNPDNLTATELQASQEQAQQWAQTEQERVIAEAVDRDATQRSADAVKQTLLDQLNTTAKFSPAVNETYATLVSAFYTAMAGREGLTPEQMYQRYPLLVGNGQQAAPGSALESVPPAPSPEALARAQRYQERFLAGRDPATLTPEERAQYEALGRPQETVADATMAPGGQYAQNQNPDDQGAAGAGRQQPAAQELGRSVAGEPPAPGWARATSIRRGAGPITVYRGAGAALQPRDFDLSALGQASGNPSSGLGVWFTEGQGEAGRYGNVEPMQLDMRKPKVIKADELPGFDSVEEAHTWREGLRAQGFDGIVVTARHLGKPELHFVVFDPQQAVYPQAKGGVLEQPAFHGTPHNIGPEGFSTEKIGTGEGNQSYGWGLYFAEDPGIAHSYRKALAPPTEINRWSAGSMEMVRNGNYVDYSRRDNTKLAEARAVMIEEFMIHEGDVTQAFDSGGVEAVKAKMLELFDTRAENNEHLAREFKILRNSVETGVKFNATQNKGAVYQVDIPDVDVDTFLLWDKPFSEQPEVVQKALRAIGYGDDALDMTGGELYKDTAWDLDGTAGDKPASELLLKNGVKGVKYLDANSRTSSGDPTRDAKYNLVVFDDSIIKITHKDGSPVTDAERAEFLQGANESGAQSPRGTFDPTTLQLNLINADLSTFVHESGHFFLEVMADIAQRPNAPAGTVEDMNKLLKWFGVEDIATWKSMTLDQQRKYHERFAESFEQYLLEGKAPSAELRPLFRKISAWMANVYRSLREFVARHPDEGIALNDEVRSVFDRLLISNYEVQKAEENAGLQPDEDATSSAVERLAARSMRDMKWLQNARSAALKNLQAEADTLRREMTAAVRAELEETPVYKAMRFLRTGELTNEVPGQNGQVTTEEIKATKGYRLNTEALLEMYPETALNNPDLTRLRGMTAKNGLHPDLVAGMFEFRDGDQLVRSLVDADTLADATKALVDRRMLEEHGDLIDERAMQNAANEAVHNTLRTKVLAAELAAQRDAMTVREDTGRRTATGRKITVDGLVKAAEQFAKGVVDRAVAKDIRGKSWEYTAAERRAAKRWEQATAAGDTAAAIKAKQDQLLNNAIAKEFIAAQGEMRKISDLFRKVAKGNDEKTVQRGRDPDVVNAARAVLQAYGYDTPTTKSAVDYLNAVKSYDPAMWEALHTSVEGAMQQAQPMTALTMAELRALHEEIDALWHLSKRSRQMEVGGNLMDIEDAAVELTDRMDAIGVPQEMPGEKKALTPREQAGRVLQHAASLLRRTEQWAEGMDGKYGGPFQRLVFQPVKDAANAYRTDRVSYRKKYRDLVEKIEPTLHKGVIQAPEIGYTFGTDGSTGGHTELLHALLHTGNESNKRKLLLGRRWASVNEDGTLNTTKWDSFVERMQLEGYLNKGHYDFAQGVWDLLDELKPMAQKTHRDVFGRYFAEVTATSFETPFGSYKGGYVPAQADPRLTIDVSLRKLAETENENMQFAFPATNRGFTKSRVDYNRPLLLDLRTMSQHIDKVLLFSHMEPVVRSANRLLREKGVSYRLGRIDPTIYDGMLTPWLNRSARQMVETPVVGDGGISRMFSILRSRAGMGVMFANISNTLQQTTGFSSAYAKMKSDGLQSELWRTTAQFVRAPKAMINSVTEASEFMRNRVENEIAAIDNTINDILLDASVYDNAKNWTAKHAYFLQSAMANTMEPIIWTASYNAQIEKTGDVDLAVNYADSVIRQTQGSSLPEDISRIESGPAFVRLFTQFAGYFNMLANTNATALKQIAQDVGLKNGAGRALYITTMGMLMPIWIAEAISQAMRGGPADDDGDGWLDDWLAAVFGVGTIKGVVAAVPGVSQLTQVAVNQWNDNPTDDRMSLSPAVTILENSVRAPNSVYEAMVEGKRPDKAVRDVASLVTITTGLPVTWVAKPIGYLTATGTGHVTPTSTGDAVRGVLTGVASPESRR